MSAAVAIEKVQFEQKPVLARLLQLYLHDFTEFETNDLDESGQYPYRYLDEYWDPAPGEERHAYFFRAGADRQLAGFAMIRVVNSYRVMSEFFVVRQYRRDGVGTTAARLLFEAHPGAWLIHAVAANLPAQAFWRRVVSEATAGVYDEEVGDGVTQRFVIRTSGEQGGGA